MTGNSVRKIQLQFPQAGVNRQAAYAQQEPYASLWAVNVRGADPIELRRRGGSRPGLERVIAQNFPGGITAIDKIAYIDQAGALQHVLAVIAGGVFFALKAQAVTENIPLLNTAGNPLLTESGQALTYVYSYAGFSAESPDDILYVADGVPLTTESGEYITVPVTVAAVNAIGDCGAYSTAQYGGRLYLAGGDGVQLFDPAAGTLSALAASAGVLPEDNPLICFFRDRLFLAGASNIVYASKVGDPSNWLTGGDAGDGGQAMAFGLEKASVIGQKITAMFPVEDAAVVFATRNSLWLMQDDPAAGGGAKNISREVGVVGQGGVCRTADGLYVLLAANGLYLWGIGSAPAPLTPKGLPLELRDIDSTTNAVTMVYEHKSRGVYISVTPAAGGLGSHWFFDLEAKALWPIRLQAGHQPVAVCAWDGGAVLGGADGYLRRFNADKTTDDGTALSSHVLIGPLRVSADMMDGMVQEIHGTLADNAGTVTCRVLTGNCAEGVSDAAVEAVEAELMGGVTPRVAYAGTWTENRNPVDRPRARGAWVVLWLSSKTKWAYENISLVTKTLGRLR